MSELWHQLPGTGFGDNFQSQLPVWVATILDFSATVSESVAQCEFDCAAVEIQCGNWRQPRYCVGRLPPAVIAVVVPGHAVSETFAQVESRPPIRLLGRLQRQTTAAVLAASLRKLFLAGRVSP